MDGCTLSMSVFRSHLKLSRVVDSLRLLGRWFHNVGTDTLKDLEANVLHLVHGITSKLQSRLDLRVLLLVLCLY